MATPSFIEINPSTNLTFNYVPNKCLPAEIRIMNTSNTNVAVKVRTTQPNSYLVKPHTFILVPMQLQLVEVTMQPIEFNPQNSTIKDKFQISVLPTASDVTIKTLEWKD